MLSGIANSAIGSFVTTAIPDVQFRQFGYSQYISMYSTNGTNVYGPRSGEFGERVGVGREVTKLCS